MNIVMRDGRTFEGTALQIVRAMQDQAGGLGGDSVPQYVRFVVFDALEFEGLELDVQGATDEELAESLVAERVRAGLTLPVH